MTWFTLEKILCGNTQPTVGHVQKNYVKLNGTIVELSEPLLPSLLLPQACNIHQSLQQSVIILLCLTSWNHREENC